MLTLHYPGMAHCGGLTKYITQKMIRPQYCRVGMVFGGKPQLFGLTRHHRGISNKGIGPVSRICSPLIGPFKTKAENHRKNVSEPT